MRKKTIFIRNLIIAFVLLFPNFVIIKPVFAIENDLMVSVTQTATKYTYELGNTTWRAQSFVLPADYRITGARIAIGRGSGYEDVPYLIEIREGGTNPSNGELILSDIRNVSELPTLETYPTMFDIEFTSSSRFTINTTYYIKISATTGTNGGVVRWTYSTNGSYADGKLWLSDTSSYTSRDFEIDIYGTTTDYVAPEPDPDPDPTPTSTTSTSTTVEIDYNYFVIPIQIFLFMLTTIMFVYILEPKKTNL